jgi:hypothetical protein
MNGSGCTAVALTTTLGSTKAKCTTSGGHYTAKFTGTDVYLVATGTSTVTF